MAVLGYLAKLEKDLGLSFQAHFLHDFSVKMFLIKSHSIGKVSMSHLISFSRYQTIICFNIVMYCMAYCALNPFSTVKNISTLVNNCNSTPFSF